MNTEGILVIILFVVGTVGLLYLGWLVHKLPKNEEVEE